MGVIIFAALVFLALDIWAAIEFGNVATMKGHEDKSSMIIGMCIFLPIAGYLLAIALPDNSEKHVPAAPAPVRSVSVKAEANVGDDLPEL